MKAFFRSALMMAVGAVIAVGVSTVPTRAADNSKALIDKLSKRVSKLEKKLKYMRVEKGTVAGSEGPNVIFEGCNLHLRSGSGDTLESSGRTYLGNLIVGYNEEPQFYTYGRGGSHNVVVGRLHEYDGFGGFVCGKANWINGEGASVTGGYDNLAIEDFASVSGGTENVAYDIYSHVCGGLHNVALGGASNISGGRENRTNSTYSSVNGGYKNSADGVWSTVNGGRENTASGNYSCVGGGNSRTAAGVYDWVAGSLLETD